MTTYILVDIGFDNDLLLDYTKPLPELMLTYHLWASMRFTCYMRTYQMRKILKLWTMDICLEILFQNYSHISETDEVISNEGGNIDRISNEIFNVLILSTIAKICFIITFVTGHQDDIEQSKLPTKDVEIQFSMSDMISLIKRYHIKTFFI